MVYGSRDLESTTAGKARQNSKSKRLGVHILSPCGAEATDLQGKPPMTQSSIKAPPSRVL